MLHIQHSLLPFCLSKTLTASRRRLGCSLPLPEIFLHSNVPRGFRRIISPRIRSQPCFPLRHFLSFTLLQAMPVLPVTLLSQKWDGHYRMLTCLICATVPPSGYAKMQSEMCSAVVLAITHSVELSIVCLQLTFKPKSRRCASR